jgi:predicted transcriptional regulator
MSTLTLRLPDGLDQQIRKLAERQHLTRSDFARRALERFVQQTQQELALQAMVASAQAIQASPLLRQHISNISDDFSATEADGLLSVAEADPDNASQGWWQ